MESNAPRRQNGARKVKRIATDWQADPEPIRTRKRRRRRARRAAVVESELFGGAAGPAIDSKTSSESFSGAHQPGMFAMLTEKALEDLDSYGGRRELFPISSNFQCDDRPQMMLKKTICPQNQRNSRHPTAGSLPETISRIRVAHDGGRSMDGALALPVIYLWHQPVLAETFFPWIVATRRWLLDGPAMLAGKANIRLAHANTNNPSGYRRGRTNLWSPQVGSVSGTTQVARF
jgi:hypothetical protein